MSGQVDVNISISTAFGCPMEGDVPAEEVLRLGDFFAERGAQGITICDTTGMANPAQVEALCQGLIQRWSNLELTLHFHNTRGMGLRSEEHTSELQSLMRISYAVFCLKKKNT